MRFIRSSIICFTLGYLLHAGVIYYDLANQPVEKGYEIPTVFPR